MTDLTSIDQYRKSGKKAGQKLRENLKAILKEGWVFEKPMEKIVLIVLQILGIIKLFQIIA